LQKGVDLSGAYATSDFHSAAVGADLWPCQFSETWLYVPDVSPVGVLQALHQGAMFGVHGHVARRVEFAVSTPGLARPAMAGEAIRASAGSSVTATLRLEVPETDWDGQPNRVDAVELIAIRKDSVAVIATAHPTGSGEALRATITLPGGGIVLRARGRRNVPNSPALMFYTNPIRIVTDR
jgi:hypothetical protein